MIISLFLCLFSAVFLFLCFSRIACDKLLANAARSSAVRAWQDQKLSKLNKFVLLPCHACSSLSS